MRTSSPLAIEALPRTNFHRMNSPVPDLPSSLPDRLPMMPSDSLHPRSPSSSPLSKRTKLHRDRTTRKLINSVAVSGRLGENTENSPVNLHNQLGELRDSSSSKVGSEIKSGNLVLVGSPRGPLDRSRSRSYPSESRTPPRCPSIVQVCRRYHEHWAVVRRTRHRLTEKPQFLSLRRCRVVRTRACQFTIHLDGAEGRAYTFEASSPELADEWVRAFTPLVSPASEMCSHPRLRKPLESINVILEEEEEDMTVASPPQPRKQFSSDNIVTLEEEDEDAFEEAFISSASSTPEQCSIVNRTISSPAVCEDVCDGKNSSCDGKNSSESSTKSTWLDVVLRDILTARPRTTSLPILYEEEEVELEP